MQPMPLRGLVEVHRQWLTGYVDRRVVIKGVRNYVAHLEYLESDGDLPSGICIRFVDPTVWLDLDNGGHPDMWFTTVEKLEVVR